MDFPIIDMAATGDRINRIRKDRGISVSTIKDYLGLRTSYAVYKWFHGRTLPTLDNLLALSVLLGTTINDLIVTK